MKNRCFPGYDCLLYINYGVIKGMIIVIDSTL